MIYELQPGDRIDRNSIWNATLTRADTGETWSINLLNQYQVELRYVLTHDRDWRQLGLEPPEPEPEPEETEERV